MSRDEEGRVQWNLDLKRRLYNWKIGEPIELSSLLDRQIFEDGEDNRAWNFEKFGNFSVASCYKALHQPLGEQFQENEIWDPMIPTKISFFAWLVCHNSILTQDNLARRGNIIVNRCVLCLKDSESVNHLLLNYPFTRELWEVFLHEFGVQWVFHNDVRRLFAERQVEHFTKARNLLWRFLAISWIIWLKRNDRIFNDKYKDLHKITLCVKAIVFYWSSPTKLLTGFRFEDLVFRWDRVVKSIVFSQ
ncbi:Reverse transcriptase zinc-binding domain [Macleaya cordata]|uniref:Reverse transcriptase zinc-binding domain n=1 Tax=Macleaya cordata TaxID=56857 RepID=A0A200R8H7_MACCD|nr:Reverse transcriptase zinc-binding domain [Macleaya cordata]